MCLRLGCPLGCGISAPQHRTEPTSPALEGRFLTAEPQRSPVPPDSYRENAPASMTFPESQRADSNCQANQGREESAHTREKQSRNRMVLAEPRDQDAGKDGGEEEEKGTTKD